MANDLVARGGKATLLLVVTDRVRDEFRRFADAENTVRATQRPSQSTG